MTYSIIIPVIIVIICFTIVYGIINYRYNKNIINTMENFQSQLQIKDIENFKKGLYNNTEIITQMANGTWTSEQSNVDPNYNVTGSILSIDITSNNITANNNNQNYGTISIINIETKNVIGITNITSILNNTIITSGYTVSESGFNVPNSGMIIEFVGLLDSTKKSEIEKEVYYTNQTQVAIVYVYIGNSMIAKYASYKIYNNQVSSDVFKILISQSFNINNLPQVYDYDTYNVIINSYVFPDNSIKFNFSDNTNNTIVNTIKKNYLGKITFAIQRVYSSPTGNEIITNLSQSFKLSALRVNKSGELTIIPDSIEIVPVSTDITVNKLKSSFKPIRTIIYFFKFDSISNVKYGYSDNSLISVNSSVMNFSNNGQSMFAPKIQYNHIDTVYQNNTYKYNITLLTTVTNDMKDSTIINFSTLLSQL